MHIKMSLTLALKVSARAASRAADEQASRHGYANEMGKGSLTYGTRQQQRCADVSMIAA